VRWTARAYAREKYAAVFYTLGITEHASAIDNIWSLSNLVLMTGHLGYESTGLNALRGQNNVQGLNDAGANPSYFPGYQAIPDQNTFTNTERRVNRVRKALPPPGNAREDWRIVVDLARALGAEWPEYATAEDAWNEFADLSPNWSGIRYDRLEEVGLQWPCTDRDHPGSKFLHSPHPALPGGRGRLFPVEYQPPIELPDDEYPFVLSTGRTLYHYNSATM